MSLKLPTRRLTRAAAHAATTAPPTKHMNTTDRANGTPPAKRLKATVASKTSRVDRVTRGGWFVADAIAHLSTTKAGLGAAISRHGAPQHYSDPERLKLTPFESLCKMIVYQQLAGAAAQTIWGRVGEVLGGECTPQRVLAAEESRMRGAGLSGAKLSYLQNIATAFASGSLDNILTMPTEELNEKLIAIKGVGPWTVDMFSMFVLQRPDVLPVGDLGVRKGIAAHFGLKALPDKKKCAELAAAWRPYASVASWLMWRIADTVDPSSSKKK